MMSDPRRKLAWDLKKFLTLPSLAMPIALWIDL
jgi:hypothetical protein